MKRSLYGAVILWLAATIGLISCDTSFEVFGDSDNYYSLLGVLDASLDTQWVRVELLQDSMLTDTGPIDALVTTTQQSTARKVIWHDSVFSFIGGARAHNFWTVEPILPLETYRFDVIRSDGAKSSATVTLPDAFPDPGLNASPFSLINLPVSGNVCAKTFDAVFFLDQLAALELTYYVPTRRETETVHRVSYIPKAIQYPDGHWEVIFEWVADLLELSSLDQEIGLTQLLNLRAVELRIAAAGPNWPDNTLDDETVALPGAVTFVENGFGFVGGVVSKKIDLPMGDFRDRSCFE